MSDEPLDKGVHDVAGGWIQERKGTPVPAFLKLAYIGFSLFGIVYLLLYASGELDHATRGPLVRQLNSAMSLPGGAWIAFMAAILVAFAAVLLAYAFAKKGQDE